MNNYDDTPIAINKKRRKQRKRKIYKNEISILLKATTEFLGSFIFGFIYCFSFAFFGNGIFTIQTAGLSIITLQYIMHPLSGGYLNPTFVLASFVVQNTDKFGKDVTKRALTAIIYIIVQFLGVLVADFYVAFSTGTDPIFVEPTVSVFITGFTSELIGVFFFTLVFLFGVDKEFGYENRIIINVKGKIRNERTICPVHSLIVGFSYIAIATSISFISGGALNLAVGISTNIATFLWTITTPDFSLLRNALFYLISHIFASIFASLAFYIYKSALVSNKNK